MSFKWSYIALPLAVFIISVILSAIFYFQLSGEVAYRFDSEGDPESWISRGTITLLTLGLQLFIIVIVSLIIRIIANYGRSIEQTSEQLDPHKFMLIMGNIAALPQLILTIVMFDIFSYNILERHLLSTWLLVLIFAIIGGIVLAVFFVRTFMRSRNTK